MMADTNETSKDREENRVYYPRLGTATWGKNREKDYGRCGRLWNYLRRPVAAEMSRLTGLSLTNLLGPIVEPEQDTAPQELRYTLAGGSRLLANECRLPGANRIVITSASAVPAGAGGRPRPRLAGLDSFTFFVTRFFVATRPP